MTKIDRYMMIPFGSMERRKVSDVLSVFVKYGYFTSDKMEITYYEDLDMYYIDIYDIKFEVASFIGDMLEVTLGRDVGWMCVGDDGDEEDI